MGAVMYFSVLVILTYLSTIKASYVDIHATCADEMILYADGQTYGTHDNKASTLDVSVPADTQVLSIECQIKGSDFGGILASVNLEQEGSYVTDTTWRCTNQYVTDWNSAYFDDNNWGYATSFGNNNGDSYPKLSNVKDYVHWIWTDSPSAVSGDDTVYCRGHMAYVPTGGNYGRRFVVGFMQNLVYEPNEREITFYITTLKPTQITVRISTPRITQGDLHVDTVLSITAGEVVTYVLPRKLRHDNNHKMQDKGILITATDFIRIVGENQETHSTDMVLYFPVTSLGLESNSVEYYAVCWDSTDDCRILIVAAFDDTTVTVNSPNTDILYNGVNHAKNSSFTIHFEHKYQSLQLSSLTGFSGTYIQANKPTSAFSGNKKTVVSNLRDGSSADHLVEQLLPVITWGREFILTPLPNSDNGLEARMGPLLQRYKIMGAEENTNVTIHVFDSVSGTEIGTESFTLNAGTVHDRDHKTGSIGVIRSTKGIMVAQFATTMTSPKAIYNTVGNCLGDPWLQLIPPTQEYFNEYGIITSNLTSTTVCQPRHFITIIINKVEKEGLTINQLPIDWSTCKQEGTCADIPTTNLIYLTKNLVYGQYRVQHALPSINFAVYFFGYGVYDSYATLGGNRLAPVNMVCVPTKPSMGDGLDNDCDGNIDEDDCAMNDLSKDCANPSPVNGEWSEWKEAGPCVCQSGSNSGKMPYKRTCTNPKPLFNGWPCLDQDKIGNRKKEDCLCDPVDGGWTDWSEWSDCKPWCGPGKITRKRTCTNPYTGNGGSDCEGDVNEQVYCFKKECKNVPLCTSTTSTTDYSDRLLPYGPAAGDFEAFTIDNERHSGTLFGREIKIPKTAFLTNNYCRKCYMAISSSGYVGIRSKKSKYNRRMYMKRRAKKWQYALNQNRRRAVELNGGYIIAPFWSDTNFTIGGPSQVYYQIYSKKDGKDDPKVQTVLDRCNAKVHKHTAFSDFKAKYVTVVTWVNMIPSSRYVCDNEKNTFQLALISDQKRSLTFALFLYGDISWYITRPVHVGYYLQSPLNAQKVTFTEKRFSDVNRPYRKKRCYKIDTWKDEQIENPGEFFHVLGYGSKESDPEEMCLDWYDRENEQTPVPLYSWYKNWNTPRYLQYVQRISQRSRSCPCDIKSARVDWRWVKDREQLDDEEKICFVQQRPVWYTSQSCCYDRVSRNLITMEDGSAGQTYLFHPRLWWTKGYYKVHDEPYKKFCCEDSSNCDKFYELRPTSTCERYRPPKLSWSFGDPHIRTMDGHRYIFNGVGEYVLIDTAAHNFTLHARTEQVVDEHGNVKSATVFSAIAARDHGGDVVQVELNAGKTGLSLYALASDITNSWFNMAADGDDNYNYQNVTITKLSQTQVVITFDSGFSVLVGYGEQQLSVTAAATEEFHQLTSGLLGVLNGDVSDDYTLRNGDRLSITLPESEVYSQFGEHWRTTSEESIFIYHDGKNHSSYLPPSDYKPLFYDVIKDTLTPSKWIEMNKTCQGNRECLFDFAVTGNSDLANLTYQIDQGNTDITDNLANARPVVVVEKWLNVTIGVEAALVVKAMDIDVTDDVTLLMSFKKLDGTDISNQVTLTSNTFKWTPITEEPVVLRFTAIDSRDAVSSEVVVQIRFCACSSDKGQCKFDEFQDGQDLVSPFLVVECECNVGWTGDTCTADIDGCLDNPCGCDAGTICIGADSLCEDVPAADDNEQPGGAYICGPCNEGYRKRSGPNSDCVDTDECRARTHGCDAMHGSCFNNFGSYECECDSGYRLGADNKNCEDIDECAEMTYDCDHQCINVPGSYDCICEDGHTINTDSRKCSLDPVLYTSCNNLDCDHCRDSPTGVECFCPDGYQLSADGKTCADKDECSTNSHQCNHQMSECNNIKGGYHCICHDGYSSQKDGRTCTACEEDSWGPDCVNPCNCKDGNECNPVTGCTQCNYPGFKGGNCDEDVDECENKPCGANTLSCMNTFGSFYCVCRLGYQLYNSTHCQDIDECESFPCLNGGSCINKNGPGYTCQCVEGFHGDSCEIAVNECDSNPCMNGGVCMDLINQYRCQCTPDYRGLYCQINIKPTYDIPASQGQDQSGGVSTAVVASVTTVLAVVAVIAIIGGVVFYFKNKNAVKTMKRMKGAVAPDSSQPSREGSMFNIVGHGMNTDTDKLYSSRDITLIPRTPKVEKDLSFVDC